MIGLVAHQVRYDLRSFWRNSQARFFTLLLPLLFLVILASVFGNDTGTLPSGAEIKQTTYFVPAIATLAVVSAGFVNLVIAVAIEREAGILKRRRATPVPAAVLIAAKAVVQAIIALACVALLMVVGRIAYGATLRVGAIPSVVLATLVGTLSFCALGYALVSFVANEDAATPVVQAMILPLYFISGVFVPADSIPSALASVGDVFPVKHLANAFLAAFDPSRGLPAIAWGDLGIVVAWGLLGAAVAVRRFSWAPRG